MVSAALSPATIRSDGSRVDTPGVPVAGSSQAVKTANAAASTKHRSNDRRRSTFPSGSRGAGDLPGDSPTDLSEKVAATRQFAVKRHRGLSNREFLRFFDDVQPTPIPYRLRSTTGTRMIQRRVVRRLLGETIRDIGILLLVFGPLDAIYQDTPAGMLPLALAVCGLCSMALGIILEARGGSIR